jgi:dihydrolipoamide dehydrogenase
MSEKYDMAVIGSGSGGSEAALLAAEKGFRSILIEKDSIGGTRFHRGCFAVRALHAPSRVYLQIAKSRNFGIQTEILRSSLVDWIKSQRAASTRLAEELRQRLEKLCVRLAADTGSLIGKHEIQIMDSFGRIENIDAEHIILATGSRPDYSGIQGSRFLNSDDLIARIDPPNHLYHWWRVCRLRIRIHLPSLGVPVYFSGAAGAAIGRLGCQRR